MSGKQKLKRAYINVGYPRHADILSLTHRFGIQGKCASYDLILAMSEASGGIIDKDAFLYTCKLNEVQDPEAYLTYCIQKGIFQEVDGGYTNSFVAKDQESYAKKLEEDKERKKNKNGNKTESVRNPSGNKKESDRKLDIDIDNDLNNKIKIVNLPEATDPSAWPPKINPNDPLAKWLPDAHAQFEQSSPVCITSGRRQMTLYPEIWITSHELAEVFRQMEKKLPSEEWRSVFQKVKAWAVGKIAEGVNPKRINTPSALMGWALDEVVDAHTKDLRLQKQKAR